MKIGINGRLLSTPRWSGQQNYLYYLLPALAEVDCQNTYTIYLPCPMVRPLDLPDNFEVQLIGPSWGWGQLALAYECRMRPPDILFSPTHTLPVLRSPRFKTVLTVHDTATTFVRHQVKEELMLGHAARSADQVIAVSEATADDLGTRFGIPRWKISVIYEGYGEEVFHPRSEKEVQEVREKYGLKKGRDYILALSTLQPRKNFERLIEAFSRLELKTSLLLVIVGGKGWDYEAILAAPRKFGVGEQVRFLGHVPDGDVPPLLSGARVFAYPSLYEGFGLPVLEAMACGVPVLTSNTSSLPEVAGSAGVLADPYEVDSIQGGLERLLLLDADAQADLVARGFRQVSRFSWEKAARETLALFEEVYEKG